MGAILNAEPLGAGLETFGNRRAMAKGAAVWESARGVGWHDRHGLEGSHILQPREEALRVSPGDEHRIGQDQGLRDVQQEAPAQGESQATHVYRKASSSRQSILRKSRGQRVKEPGDAAFPGKCRGGFTPR